VVGGPNQEYAPNAGARCRIIARYRRVHMTEAAGPVFTGGFTTIATSDGTDKYDILFLPDKHNDELQREGKAPCYYWMPSGVRMARKGDTGDYKFHLIHFVGVMSGDTTVGVEGTKEVAGGVLSLTTTAAFPAGVLEDAKNKLQKKFQGNADKYWGWRSPLPPEYRPVPIVSNITTLSNLSPEANGTVPGAVPATPVAGPTPTPTPTPAPAGGPGGPGGGPRSMIPAPRFPAPVLTSSPRTVPFRRSFTGRDTDLSDNLNAWYFRLQGQGPGSIDPLGENAYSGLVGSLPAAILWQGFHGAYSPISVSQTLKIQVWTQSLRLTVDGHWDRIFEHFSANAKGRAWWFDADISVELNNLMISGGLTVHMEIDGTVPGADKMREEANKRIDAVRESFMKQAEKRIFDPAPPDVKPAEASNGGGILGGIFGFGGGFALKYRRDETHLDLHYEEVVDTKYLQETTISSTLEGFYDVIKKDPDAEKKYFTTLFLDDWDRKVTRIVKPVVNWPDPTKAWVGDPVAFVSVQIGYPSVEGDVQWAPHQFDAGAIGPASTWQMAAAKKKATDVANPPEGWAPDITYVRRQIHFKEPPGESDYPNMRVFVEQNVVDLDPGEHGTPTDLSSIEVRADSAGKLEVGPVTLNIDLDTAKQIVEVEFKALGKRIDGTERGVTRFTWSSADQMEPRYWEIFTGQLDYQPIYQYRVHVVVKGNIFTKGMEWFGPWVDVQGNGPLMVTVPTQDDPGVTNKRSLTPREITSTAPLGLKAPGAPRPSSTRPPIGAPSGAPAPAHAPARVGGPPPASRGRGPSGPPTTSRDAPTRRAPATAATLFGYSTKPIAATAPRETREVSGAPTRAASGKSDRSSKSEPAKSRPAAATASMKTNGRKPKLELATGWSDRAPRT
jgi:hypothetical protein